MNGFQHVTIAGNLGQDPELRRTASDLSVCNISIAVNEKRGQTETVTWFRCVVFGKGGEIVHQYLKKGDGILLSGRIQTGEYQARDGTTRYTWELIADQFRFLGSGGQGGQAKPQQHSAPVPDDDLADDIPF